MFAENELNLMKSYHHSLFDSNLSTYVPYITWHSKGFHSGDTLHICFFPLIHWHLDWLFDYLSKLGSLKTKNLAVYLRKADGFLFLLDNSFLNDFPQGKYLKCSEQLPHFRDCAKHFGPPNTFVEVDAIVISISRRGNQGIERLRDLSRLHS